jgi:hypothetical protein
VSEALSLMEFLQELLADPGTRAGFLADPQGMLAAQGLAHLSPADVHDALVLVEDARTVDFSPGVMPGQNLLAAPGEQADTAQYLRSFLGDPDADLDTDAGLAPDAASAPGDHTLSFGTGDASGGHDVDDLYGTPEHAAPADPFASWADLDAASTGHDAGFGNGDDVYGTDPYEPDAHDVDPGDPGAGHHDFDF